MRHHDPLPSRRVLWNALLALRAIGPREARTILKECMPIERRTVGGLRCWVDTGHGVIHPSGRRIATRAITDTGEPVWLVAFEGHEFAFPSDCPRASEAFEEAQAALSVRRLLAAREDEIVSLRWRVLLGTARFAVTPDDARNAGLSAPALRDRLRRLGLGARTALPARALLVPSLFDPAAGYALLVSHARHRAEAPVRTVLHAL